MAVTATAHGGRGGGHHLENATHERKAVGMDSAGRQAQQHVSGNYAGSVDDSILVDAADSEAGHVILS